MKNIQIYGGLYNTIPYYYILNNIVRRYPPEQSSEVVKYIEHDVEKFTIINLW